MREYKFRGKPVDEKAGNWVYGSLVFKRNGTPCIHFYDPNPQKFECIYEVDPETVGEYTGLKDKNGKEIYEGDILKCKVKDKVNDNLTITYKHVNNVIEWWESISAHGYRLRHGRFTMMLKKYALVTMEAEVIGNIYENSDILKGGDKVEGD